MPSCCETFIKILSTNVNKSDWNQVGSQRLNEYTTENMFVMCFPEILLDGKGDPKTKLDYVT